MIWLYVHFCVRAFYLSLSLFLFIAMRVQIARITAFRFNDSDQSFLSCIFYFIFYTKMRFFDSKYIYLCLWCANYSHARISIMVAFSVAFVVAIFSIDYSLSFCCLPQFASVDFPLKWLKPNIQLFRVYWIQTTYKYTFLNQLLYWSCTLPRIQLFVCIT